MTGLMPQKGYTMRYREFIYEKPEVRIVGHDILAVQFWKPEFCELVIQAAENIGEFQSSPNDPVPGAELRINKISEELYISYCKHWKYIIQPILEDFYQLPTEQWFSGWKVPFIIKYTMNGQRSLRKHFDASLISGSIKLNTKYDGAELIFPRQKFSNKEIPIGWMILWPSSIQHIHFCNELKQGTKYSLTCWTKQEAKEQGINYRDV